MSRPRRDGCSKAQFDAIVERLRAIDPDLVLAADEQDGELLTWFATLTPSERLDRAARMALELEGLRDARHFS